MIYINEVASYKICFERFQWTQRLEVVDHHGHAIWAMRCTKVGEAERIEGELQTNETILNLHDQAFFA